MPAENAGKAEQSTMTPARNSKRDRAWGNGRLMEVESIAAIPRRKSIHVVPELRGNDEQSDCARHCTRTFSR